MVAKMKLYYEYYWYRFYRLGESSDFKWLSKWKATLALCFVDFMICFSTLIYLEVLMDMSLVGNRLTGFILIALPIILFNYYLFDRHKKYELIIEKFDNLPRKKNSVGIMLFWIGNLMFVGYVVGAYYLLSISN